MPDLRIGEQSESRQRWDAKQNSESEMASYQIVPPETFNFARPEEWPKWIRRFERFRQASDLSSDPEESQVNSLIYSMGDQADDVLHSFVLSEEDQKKYGTVRDRLERHFIKPRNVIYERAKFNQRKQMDSETADSCITALYGLTEHCEKKKKKHKEGCDGRHNVTADVMSEEEPDRDKFMQHHASWVKCFVTKLENRFIKSHSAKPRMYGSSIDRPFPAGIPTWMKGTYSSKGNMSPENDERVAYGSSEKLFHGSDVSESSDAKLD